MTTDQRRATVWLVVIGLIVMLMLVSRSGRSNDPDLVPTPVVNITDLEDAASRPIVCHWFDEGRGPTYKCEYGPEQTKFPGR